MVYSTFPWYGEGSLDVSWIICALAISFAVIQIRVLIYDMGQQTQLFRLFLAASAALALPVIHACVFKTNKIALSLLIVSVSIGLGTRASSFDLGKRLNVLAVPLLFLLVAMLIAAAWRMIPVNELLPVNARTRASSVWVWALSAVFTLVVYTESLPRILGVRDGVRVHFSELAYSFEISEATTREISLSIENDSTIEATVIGAYSQCGCLRTKLVPKVIPPGSSANLVCVSTPEAVDAMIHTSVVLFIDHPTQAQLQTTVYIRNGSPEKSH